MMRMLSVLALVAASITTTSVDAVWPSGVKLTGINYDMQICKNADEEYKDLYEISKIARSVRVYGLSLAPECPITRFLDTAKSMGLTVGLGMWLDKTTNFDNQLAGLDRVLATGKVDSNVIGFHVGSEAIYREDHTADQAVNYLERTRELFKTRNIPMKLTIADVVDMYYQFPQLLNAVDYVSLNQFSFWEKVDPSVAMEKMLDRIRSIRAQAAAQGKEVMISETGWASGGSDPLDRCSVPSIANQRSFFSNFYHQMTTHNIPYYWFVAYDALWYTWAEASVEMHFGVMNPYSRQLKESYTGVDFTPRNITTVQSARGLLAETFNQSAPEEVSGVEIMTQTSNDKLVKVRYQWFFDTSKKQFRSVNSDRCLDAYEPKNGGTVHTYTCSETNGNQQWRYDAKTQQIQHVLHEGFCMEDRVDGGEIQLWKCNATNANQKWGLAAPPGRSCPNIEEGVDYVGNDVGSAESSTAEGCCSICVATTGCNVFSWTNHNGGTCWLKSAKSATTTKAGTRSAVVVATTLPPTTTTPTTTTTTTTTTPTTTTTTPTTSVPSTCSTIEKDVDYVGNDLSNAASTTAEGCCAICKGKTGCNAYSWNDYMGGTCWLKSAKGQTTTKAGARSAVIRSGCSDVEEGVDYSGADVGNAVGATAEACCAVCRARTNCKAYTWTDYMGGTCWLKSAKGSATAKAGARSATVL